jgi:hypothetical protein
MSETQEIVAYLSNRQWYRATDVLASRDIDSWLFQDAQPFTLADLRKRRNGGKDVPNWIDLDEEADNQRCP